MAALAHEKVWVDKKVYDEAERQYYESRAKLHFSGSTCPITSSPAVLEIVPSVVSSKKQKQKTMDPIQNIPQNVQTSPKKSKKKNKAKHRTSSEKETEIKMLTNEFEKEVTVEKIATMVAVTPMEVPVAASVISVDKAMEAVAKDVELHYSLAHDTISNKEAKNKDNTEKMNKETTEKKNNNKKDQVVVDSAPKVELVLKGGVNQCSLASEVAKARQHIKNSLECMDSVAVMAGVPNVEVLNKLNSLENENKTLKKTVEELRKSLQELKLNFDTFTKKFAAAAGPALAPAKAAAPVAAPNEDSDDGVDLFGSDDEEESAEAARVREERLAAYNAKKSKKPVLIAKSNIILDVKPWDDETDMRQMEAAVRAVAADGLLWGAAKLVPLAYGIHKLQISCVVEDDKVSVDWLTEELENIEDYVQSVDIAAFNKV